METMGRRESTTNTFRDQVGIRETMSMKSGLITVCRGGALFEEISCHRLTISK